MLIMLMYSGKAKYIKYVTLKEQSKSQQKVN